ncbi:right-handed parallel beta-helix repeat-containing protein [Candidatus Woesebacteria bacterium]|nr:right-handed parallel beta-helix repeat-containing protein [Candidatus Woesebacteria bacterium]
MASTTRKTISNKKFKFKNTVEKFLAVTGVLVVGLTLAAAVYSIGFSQNSTVNASESNNYLSRNFNRRTPTPTPTATPIPTPSTQGTTRYVSKTGSNSNLGTLSAPWATLTYAAGMLNPGDTLYIRGGVYNEKVTFAKSGIAGAPIMIAAYPGEKPVIDGSINGQYVLPSATSRYSALVKFAGSYINVEGLEVRNSLWQGIVISGEKVTLTHVTSHDHMEQGILGWESKDLIVQDSIIYNNAKSLENGVYNFPDRTSYATGLSAGRGASRSAFLRNTIYNNWGEGLSSYNATKTVMEDNVVYDNAKNIYISDTTDNIVQRNLVYCTPGNKYRLSSVVTQHGINLQDENQQPPSANNKIINNMVVGCVTNFKWYPYTSNSAMTGTLVAHNTFVNATGTTSDAAFTIAAPVGIAHSTTRIFNNIIVQEDSKAIGSITGNLNGVSFSNNLWSKTPPPSMMGSNSKIGDPILFKTSSITPGGLKGSYFKVQPNSPAINAGAWLPEVTNDFFKISRPINGYDIGGQEFDNSY